MRHVHLRAHGERPKAFLTMHAERIAALLDI
jgi:hypothetical protein